MHPSAPMPLAAMCEGWRGRSGGGGPNQTKNQKQKQKQNPNKSERTKPCSMQQTQTQQPKAAQRQQHAVSKNTYSRDAVLSNEKDEPKMTKARRNLRRRCRYLQCVRDGEGGAAAAAPIKPETKTKNQTKAHETCPTQCNKRKSQQPKAMQPQQHAVSKNTYW